MPTFDIVKEYKIEKKSFRVSQIADKFDFTKKEIKNSFIGDIDIDIENGDWNIGVIVGRSGTGKSTIAKELFGEYIKKYTYEKDSVIDDFDENVNNDDIFEMLSSVGFSSPPSWLKPYKVLSEGEKMRVDIARALLDNKNITVFDEYTSVVDRNIAKIASIAIQNQLRKKNKKFIAVTCHYDILKWLNPDWYFDTETMKTYKPRGSLRRDKLIFKLYERKGLWNVFRNYHYLNSNIHNGSKQYVLFHENKPCAFLALLHYPHPKNKKIKMIHRIVVLPDYQGIGLAKRLLDSVAALYKDYDIRINTSLNNFVKSLKNSNKWVLERAGRVKLISKSGKHALGKTLSKNRNTYSLRYIHA